MTAGFVYAIDAGDKIKIGFSIDPRRRFTKIRSDNPDATRVIGCIAATVAQERELHDLLRPWRIRREWYRNEGPVAAFATMLPPAPPPNEPEPRLEPAYSIIKKLGGEAKVSEITGTSYTSPYRWQQPKQKGGTGGLIPQRHYRKLLDHAHINSIALSMANFFGPERPSEGAE